MKPRIIYISLGLVHWSIGLLVYFLGGIAYADVRFSGSAYSETSLINHDGTIRYGNRSDLHLKVASLSEGARLVAELDFYMLYGYLSSLTAGVGDSQQATGSDELAARSTQLLRDGQFYVDRLYLRLPISSADVILGKQRIAWGSGVIFRPTDNFNRPNPLSLSGRKEGVNALVTKVFVGDLSALDLIIAPADVFKRIDGEINLERLKYSKFASRLTLNKFKTDMAFSYQYNGGSRSHICGLDMKGDVGTWHDVSLPGYHLETVFVTDSSNVENDAIEQARPTENYWQSVLGLDYSFWGKLILLGEYFYNGSGRAKRTKLTASDFSLLDEFKYRHYLYSQISYQHDIFLGASVLLLWNMVDGSFILSPGINYSLFQNTDLNLYSQMFFGDETDEYGPARLGADQIYYLRLSLKY